MRGLGARLPGSPAPAARPPGLCKAGVRLRKAGHLHEAAGPHGAAAAAADPGGGGGGARSEPGGPGIRAPVDARLGSGPWAGAEAARGGGARRWGRGRGPRAAAQEEAEEDPRAGPGKQAEQRRRRRSPGLAMLLASAVVVWEWLNEHGRWRPYSPAVSHHIEAVVRAGPRAGGSVVLGQVDSRLAPYIIDLQSMNQFRQDTGEPAPLPHPRPLPLPALGSPASRAPRDPPNPQVRAVCHREVVVEGALYSPPSSYNPPAINVPASTIRVLVMQREPQASP